MVNNVFFLHSVDILDTEFDNFSDLLACESVDQYYPFIDEELFRFKFYFDCFKHLD